LILSTKRSLEVQNLRCMHVIEQYSSHFRKIEDEEVNKDQILLEKEAEVR